MTATGTSGPRIALVLPGGGARSAWQVGVLKAIAGWYPARAVLPFPVLCGTSAGAINAAVLAAHAGDFGRGAADLARVWAGFRVGQVFRAGTPRHVAFGPAPRPRAPLGRLAAAGAARTPRQCAAAHAAGAQHRLRTPAPVDRRGAAGLARNQRNLAHARGSGVLRRDLAAVRGLGPSRAARRRQRRST